MTDVLVSQVRYSYYRPLLQCPRYLCAVVNLYLSYLVALLFIFCHNSLVVILQLLNHEGAAQDVLIVAHILADVGILL